MLKERGLRVNTNLLTGRAYVGTTKANGKDGPAILLQDCPWCHRPYEEAPLDLSPIDTTELDASIAACERMAAGG